MAVITDSGGITEETTVMGIPCMTLRDNTERPETCTVGTNELIGTDSENIKPALDKLFAGGWKKGSVPPLWDGKTAQRIVEIIERLNSSGKKVVLLGAGSVARSYSANIKKSGCIDFIDLVDATDFRELAAILKTIKALISVDTGTMHMANAVGCPVVAVFYHYPSEKNVLKLWAPDSSLYDVITISENQTPDNILGNLKILLDKRRVY